jgi:hypothetical protein
MTSLTARQIVINRAGSGILKQLHSEEARIGRSLTPHEISKKFFVRPFDSDEDASFRLESVLWSIYVELRGNMKAACEKDGSPWSEFLLVQWVDDAVVSRRIDFTAVEIKRSGSGIMDRVRRARSYQDQTEVGHE